ncbi:hypothetical protein ACFL5F_04740 [Planctomycetota bacterium]
MKKPNYAILLLMYCLAALMGCQRADQRADPVVTAPAPAMPAEDVPPAGDRGNTHIVTSVKPPSRPAVPDEDKASLMYQAKLDLLRILICSEEQVQLGSEKQDSDALLQTVSEHFTNIGFRVIDGSPCPDYSSTAGALEVIANQRDVDMFVLLRAQSKQVDKFGDFYSFEAEGRGKVAQISDKELLTTTSAFVRGKRALNEQQAAESALQACGQELAGKLSDEILRKSARGALLRRISIDRLYGTEQVDYVRVGLSKKPGIQSVALKSWDRGTGRAIFWIRLDASVKENLAAYLEEIDNVRLKVERLDKTGTGSRQKGLLEF